MEAIFFKRLPNGHSAVVEKKPVESTSSIKKDTTDNHEVKHGYVARRRGRRVFKMTIIPGPGYRGLTVLDGPDAVAAVAAHADGHSGTGHDLAVAASLGVNISAAKAEARSIMATDNGEMAALAAALRERGTLFGSEIDSILAKGPAVELVLRILSPEGKTERETPIGSVAEAKFLLPADLPTAA